MSQQKFVEDASFVKILSKIKNFAPRRKVVHTSLTGFSKETCMAFSWHVTWSLKKRSCWRG